MHVVSSVQSAKARIFVGGVGVASSVGKTRALLTGATHINNRSTLISTKAYVPFIAI